MSEHEAQKTGNGRPSPLLILIALAAVTLVVVLVALSFIGRGGPRDAQSRDSSPAIVDASQFSSGVNPVDPVPVSDFSLTAADGSPLTLADLKGKYTVLYFGYTHCPDFCPSTMTDWRLVMRGLGDEAGRINFVMISVDPERDTPEMLARYLRPFDERIIGATGDEATLRRMVDEFGAFFELVGHDETPLYMVEHTASQFVLDPDGNFVAVYSFGTPVDVITADLRQRLDAGG